MNHDSFTSPRRTPLEIWAGIECSYVRVGDRCSDQLVSSGHDRRLDDLDRFAALGIRTLRYPISWERMAAGHIDWQWAEERLERLRTLGIRPIVGFVHHGSGPLAGGLLSPDFAAGLADFAHEVASRFPWVDAYTPVNEPGTTARFSGLYGLWHPHGRDVACFARCLVHQVDAIGRAMRAIRAINPSAQLVQTEDVGKTHAVGRLDYQADFENERRWLSFDLLCGRVDERHPLYAHLREGRIAEAELERLRLNCCPPDVLGMNHYVTSERFLDDRLHHYPPAMHGGNGRHAYVDLPAVRVRQEEVVGPAGLLRELRARYRIPIAITEVQLACTREEQLRWLKDVWEAAREVRQEGVDVRAVTAWALLGAHDWDSLLTAERGSYESGVFDLRAPVPRPTALARAIQALASNGDFAHPVLESPGWWRRSHRLLHPPISAARTGTGRPWNRSAVPTPLLIVGAHEPLGRALLEACEKRGLSTLSVTQTTGELTQTDVVRELLAQHRPWAVIHCGRDQCIGTAELQDDDHRATTLVPVSLAEGCAARGVKFLTVSSDRVFDGASAHPYLESDAPNPRHALGRCQLDMEQRCLALQTGVLVIRTGVCFGADDEADFVTRALHELAAGRVVRIPKDGLVSPTYLPEWADNALDLLIDDETGVWHLANTGTATWLEWGRTVMAMAGNPAGRVEVSRQAEAASALGRSALASERGSLMGPWQRALEQCLSRSRLPLGKLAA